MRNWRDIVVTKRVAEIIPIREKGSEGSGETVDDVSVKEMDEEEIEDRVEDRMKNNELKIERYRELLEAMGFTRTQLNHIEESSDEGIYAARAAGWTG